MFDCGDIGASKTPRMTVECAAESCASISGGLGDIGADEEVGGQERRRVGCDGVEAGVFL
jgi:hypothetical protein